MAFLNNGLKATGLGLALATGLAFSAQAVTLNMNHQWPATTVGSKVDQWFADEVEKRTDGEVKIKIFWSEGLAKAGEALELLQSGGLDMAAMSPGYFPAQLPLHVAPNSIPMKMESVEQASTLMKRLMEEVPAYAEEAEANGIKALFFHHLNPYLLVSREPITSVDQMDGKKMRTWGNDMPRMVEAVDGTPVTMMLPEIYEGLSRGVVDTAPFAVDLVVNYKIYEVAKHISEITLWEGPSWGVWISSAAWEKLTPEQRTIVEEVSAEAVKRDREAVIAAADEARATLKENGVTFHEFPQAEKDKWRNALPDFFADWIARMDEAGKGDAARQAVAIWKEVIGES
ncbi:TRAP transporter substrate-binding protein [Pseudohoeflea coraliihabitans]|uniref:C4-dicarboxylate TRAP transporter substrate-binding protein n=1 Tax=Pseudohoeflea coraliihabitans TaxID=2860393 RepID=A0ABS6WQR6_9HYPH|nr:C4-dicarboxylate TRAP transporter substrate-binding protein [Pseudohoeflea sp. DP4N28-3]MBW3098316.1 C4-dicarboxylate TRAP transporter substrate-binding protein [Pseudohoeflea sp. DP4N28-3]